MLTMDGMWWLSYCWIWTGTSSQIGSMYDELTLAGDAVDTYESTEEYDAEDLLRVGGDRDGVREGARDEPFEDAA